jgi:hypothetical protein
VKTLGPWRRAHLGLALRSWRLATRRPGPDRLSIRKGSVRFFLTLATSAGSHRWNIVKLFYGECHSPSRDSEANLRSPLTHAGVCEFHPNRATGEDRGTEPPPTRTQEFTLADDRAHADRLG